MKETYEFHAKLRMANKQMVITIPVLIKRYAKFKSGEIVLVKVVR